MAVPWTGHFVVDYGLTAILKISRSNQIDDQAIDNMAGPLRDMLAQESFELFRKKLRFFTPNCVFTQGAYGQPEWNDAIDRLIHRAKLALTSGSSICHICGKRVPEEAIVSAKRHVLPFLHGEFNFYPSLMDGMPVCGLCELAALSAFIAADHINNVHMVIPHIQNELVGKAIVDRIYRENYQKVATSTNGEQAKFRMDTPGQARADIVKDIVAQNSYRGESVTIWLINSSQRGEGEISYMVIPNRVIDHITKLDTVEYHMGLSSFHFINTLKDRCKQRGRDTQLDLYLQGKYQPELGDRWYAVRRYLTEVHGMDDGLISALTQVAIAAGDHIYRSVSNSDDVLESTKREMLDLVNSRDRDKTIRFLTRLARDGEVDASLLAPLLLYHDLTRVLQYLSVAVYDYVRCRHTGLQFDDNVQQQVQSQDQAILLMERIADSFVSMDRAATLHKRLRSAAWSGDMKAIRSLYAYLARIGKLSWRDFVLLCPPDFMLDANTEKQNRMRARAAAQVLEILIASKLRELGIQVDDEDQDEEEEDTYTEDQEVEE
jgi:hypothetical protein